MNINIARFMSHVRQLPNGCWEWTSSTNEAGYATFYVEGRSHRAFRWIIGQVGDPIDDDLEPDHVCHSRDNTCISGASCRHRRCVNPQHGDVVTHAENSRRAAYRFPTCSSGHLLPVVESGRRPCRPCANRRSREYKARQQAQRPQTPRELPPHGRGRYVHHGCRCDVCRAAESGYKRARRMRMYDAVMAGGAA